MTICGIGQTTSGTGINRIRSGSVHGERHHFETGKTGICGGPGNSTINGFPNSAFNRAHENSPGSPRVHCNGLDSSRAGADVDPCATILLRE